MATYDQLEVSVESSRPVELYEFTLGGTPFRFTSAEDDITIGVDVYTRTAVSRSRISQSSDQSNRNLSITMPTDNSYAQKYRTIPPGERATVNVFRYQRDEAPSFATQVLLFKGLVQTCKFPKDGHTAEFAVRSIEGALNKNIPLFNFAGQCQLILYSNACGATASSFDHLGAATSISGDTITVDGMSASGLDMVGGFVRPTGVNDFRLVLAQSGDVLTLLLPFQLDPTGLNIQAFAGCDKQIEGDCALVFDQVANFKGYPFVPSKDIFASGL